MPPAGDDEPLDPHAHASDRDELLRGGTFVDRTFTALDLREHDLGGKEFTGCTFSQCKAQESRWRGSRIEDCTFERCDLTQARLAGVVAGSLRFVDSKLMGIEWTELGRFASLAFTGCVLQYASFLRLGLRGAAFVDCTLTDANFFEVDLGGANFRGSTLTGTVFRRCKLRDADFSAAAGVFFDPADNEARGAVISLETAALLATHLGLRVAGHAAAKPSSDSPPARRRKSR